MLAFLLFAAAVVAVEKPKLGPVEKEHKMVVEAVRGCPEAEEGEIVVCSNDRGVAEGYRLPKLDPRFANNLRGDGRGGLTDPAPGASGTGSCSNVGAGGATGCAKADINAWAKWNAARKAQQKAYQDPN